MHFQFEPTAEQIEAAGADLTSRILWFLQQYRQSEFGDCAEADAVYEPGCRVELGSWFDTESAALLAALTPSAPIAAPVRDAKVLERAAAALCERRGFGFYTDPMEGGQNAYDISMEAIEEARVVLASIPVE